MALPDPARIGVLQRDYGRAEWWVTVNGRCAIGFGGPDAKNRAERYADDLMKIGERRGEPTKRHPTDT